jgi:hypothetical protein
MSQQAEKLTTPYKYQQFAMVECSDARHVLNCMRYDRAFPYGEDDAAIIAGLTEDQLALTKTNKFLISRFTCAANTPWTHSLWSTSFCKLTELDPGCRYRPIERIAADRITIQL